MARPEERLPENAPGDFYVDRSCIDCDTCRSIAPSIFGRSSGKEQSFVERQPETPAERVRAAMALVACPTSSIGTADKSDVPAGVQCFPEPIEAGVSYCGFAAESSFGASSYFVERSCGNVLVDSPRAARPLLKRLIELGGAARMVLTHKDDVAAHATYRAELGCERVIHRDDLDTDTAAVERVIEGHDPIMLDKDLLVIPVPGHTRGSIALLYMEQFLFTGDHLWYSEQSGHLVASRSVCWYSWAEQTRSVERLLDFRFEWVLPGHGRRYHAPSAKAMRAEVERAVQAMKTR